VHNWPGFTSTTKAKKIAEERSRNGEADNRALLFEIIVNTEDDQGVPTNIDTSLQMGPNGIKGERKWSDFAHEKEVLILPNFCFTVLDIVEND